MKLTLLCVVVFAAAFPSLTDAWWFINPGWQTKRCFCKVLNADTKAVIKDLHAIYRCKELFGCGCGHYKMKSCMANCIDEVKRWALNKCPVALRGTQLLPYYQASTCHKGIVGGLRSTCVGSTPLGPVGAGSSGSVGSGVSGGSIGIGLAESEIRSRSDAELSEPGGPKQFKRVSAV